MPMEATPKIMQILADEGGQPPWTPLLVTCTRNMARKAIAIPHHTAPTSPAPPKTNMKSGRVEQHWKEDISPCNWDTPA